MTFSETLYVQMAERADLRELLTRFFRGISLPADLDKCPNRHKRLEFAKGPGFSADAIRIVEPDSYVQALTDILGFTPTAKLMLFYDPYTNQEVTRGLLLRATLSLVRNTAWNIGLRGQNGNTVLLRTGDQLRLSSQTDLWTPQRLKLVKSPYTLTELNVPTAAVQA